MADKDFSRLEPPEVMDMLNKVWRNMGIQNANLIKLGRIRADKEKAYNYAYAKRILELKNQGHAVTLIKTLAKGDVSVTGPKWELDVAQAEFDACRESIRDMREHVGILRSFLTWMRAEYQAGQGL